MLFDLTGQTVVITAGYSYLGMAMTEGLLQHGATVALTGRTPEKCRETADKLNRQYPGRCKGYALDIASLESIETAFRQISGDWDAIDTVVHNGAFGKPGELSTMPEADFLAYIEGTINSSYRVAATALRYMLPRKKGNLINIGTMYGVVSPNPEIYGDSGQNNPAAYGAGKAGVIQLTKYIACHYGRQGIRANAISPGPFPSTAIQEKKDFIERLGDKTALGRIGQPEEIKGAVVFLASGASSYITGHNLMVDGGWTAW